MSDAPTDKKLSERFGGFDSAEQQERAVFMDAFDGADSKLFAKRVAAGIAALDKLRALRLYESHPSAIREAVEGERGLEDCSELARRIVDNCGIDWNGHDMALVVQRIMEVLRDGFDVRARGEEKGQ